MEQLRSQAFETLVGKRPNPNVPALDDALIRTISYWKRELSALKNYEISNAQLSTLFNAIIFTRALEDQNRKNQQALSEKLLLNVLQNNEDLSLRQVISKTLSILGIPSLPEHLLDFRSLDVFNTVDKRISNMLFTSFYRHENVPYEYDFSLMSKHALSRIYEHYVSVLRIEGNNRDKQLTLPLFQPLPEEVRNKEYGSIYTPQYIARFFAKYLRKALPTKDFLSIKYIDPAVGSGIFLRTLLETQFEEMEDLPESNIINSLIHNAYGIDVDENAVQATKLSLSLLHLVLTGHLPRSLNIIVNEAIKYYRDNVDSMQLKNAFDVVVANPPFVALDDQKNTTRKLVATFMQDHGSGRIDMYLAFLRLGLEMLKDGGYGMFVLPHSFLLAKSAQRMREYIRENAWIRCLADLSAIRVFEASGIYVILLIIQKKANNSKHKPKSMIIKCQEFVGRALQEALEGQRTENVYYSIYDVEQNVFDTPEWVIPPPAKISVESKFRRLPPLEEFMYVRVGFNSGANDVFIVNNENIPQDESELYIPYLSDREMEQFKVPQYTNSSFIYPYINGKQVTEDQLAKDFPKSWEYLIENREALASRKGVQKGNIPWWRPDRPRLPQNLLVPKIITPHLSLSPRFSLDQDGVFAIARSPLIYPKEKALEQDLLLFFLGILNSTPCYWYVSLHSHTYGGGYAMLEPKTLRTTPVPSPINSTPKLRRKLIDLVRIRLESDGREAISIENEIDNVVSDLYGLTSSERIDLGID